MRRRIGAGLVALLAATAGLLPPAAHAWTPDRIDRLVMDYEITPDGVVKATETFDYVHNEGNVGEQAVLLRRFTVREPDPADDAKDVVVHVDNVTVRSSADPQARIEQQVSDPGMPGDDSDHETRVRILDISVRDTVPANRRETIVLTYELRGVLERTVEGNIRFSVPGLVAKEVPPGAMSATVTAPQGVRTVGCQWNDEPCPHAKVIDGVARIDDRSPRHKSDDGSPPSLTLVLRLGLPPGSVSDVGPIREHALKVHGPSGAWVYTLVFVVAWVVRPPQVLVLLALALQLTILLMNRARRRKTAADRPKSGSVRS